ncbi:MAG: flagellar biosynthetic protein FliO [Pseudomonadota bacterium]
MEWLQNLFSGENSSAVQLVFITLLLIITLILIVWVFRRIAGSPSRRAARNRVPRLSITDSTMVDDKRYLVLVRRDNVEHLVLIGGPTDVVVETGIMRVKSAEQPNTRSAQETTAPAKEAEKTPQEKEPVATPAPSPSKVSTPEPAFSEETPAAAPVAAAAATVATAAAVQALTPEPATDPEPVPLDEVSQLPEMQDVQEIPDIAASEIEEALAEIATASIDTVDVPETPYEQEVHIEPSVASEPMEPTVLEPPTEEPEMDPVSEEPSEPLVEAEPDTETSLEASISEQLDDALSEEAFVPEPEAPTEPSVDAGLEQAGGADDEMQRLLDELAGETKETA